MRCTLLRVTPRGILLWRYHLRRLEPELGVGSRARGPLEQWARSAAPGVWALRADRQEGLQVQPRPGSRLQDGMAVRVLPTPLLPGMGPIPKPCAPSVYDAIRLDGTATLLVGPGDTGIHEACCAAVLGWDGRGLTAPPADRSRVWSTAEAAVRECLPVRDAPLQPGSMALLLVNAVKGSCMLAPAYSDGFPSWARQQVDAVLERWTEHPGDA